MLISVASVTAQNLPGKMVEAFRSGKATELYSCMEREVDFVVDNTPKTSRRDVAVDEIQRFFDEKSVRGFVVDHQGVRKESGFMIGTLNTTKGKFRVQCFLKKSDTNFLIHQIRIDGTSE